MASTPETPKPRNGEDRARAMLNGMPRYVRLLRNPKAWPDLSDRELQHMTFLGCVTFDRHPERADTMESLFGEVARRFGVSDRLRLLGTVTAFVEEGRARADALLPFALYDPADAVVAVAGREFALLHPSSSSHPLEGAETLVARLAASDTAPTRLAAVLAGLVSLGDLRLLPLVRGRAALLTGATARRALACLDGPIVTCLEVEFLLDWLERAANPEDAVAVAEALAGLPARSADGTVLQVDRVFPSTAAPAGDELGVIRQYEFQAALERVRPRLATVALLADLEGDGALATLGATGVSRLDSARVVAAVERLMQAWHTRPTRARAA